MVENSFCWYSAFTKLFGPFIIDFYFFKIGC
jgi:hypothetical protein